MSITPASETAILDVLWQSLKGGAYNLDVMKSHVQPESRFEELGIDSLDMTDFFIRIEDRFRIKIRQEDYASLQSVRDLQQYLAQQSGETSH